MSIEEALPMRRHFVEPAASAQRPTQGGPGGARTWYFADGYLPAKQVGAKVEAHEALMILNVNDEAAQLRIDFYFEQQPPILEVPVLIDGQRVRCIRLDWPQDLDGVRLPTCTQYAMRVRSNVNVIIQQGRIDTTQANLSYYGSMGFCES